jgi:hypothetical protein
LLLGSLVKLSLGSGPLGPGGVLVTNVGSIEVVAEVASDVEVDVEVDVDVGVESVPVPDQERRSGTSRGGVGLP